MSFNDLAESIGSNTKIFIDENLAVSIVDLISEIGLGQRKIILIADQKIWQKNRDFFCKNSSQEQFFKKFAAKLLLKNPAAQESEVNQIIAFAKAKKAQLILAIGSGTINDLCKFCAAEIGIDYAIIPSAASMNGYLSANASIKIRGHKKSLPAKAPIAVICDLGIIAKSPIRMTRAGIADLLCFWSCLFDWRLGCIFFSDEFYPLAIEKLFQKMNFLLQNYREMRLKNPEFLRFLMEILLISGQAMTIAKSSKPASQSEHLIAHFLEMKFPEISKKILHGELIAITTKATLRLQKQILVSLQKDCKNSQISAVSFFDRMLRRFDSSGFVADNLGLDPEITKDCQREFAAKSDLARKEIKKLQNYFAEKPSKDFLAWLEKITVELSKNLLPGDELQKIFRHFGIRQSRHFKIEAIEYRRAVENARFVRNRFTCLDICPDI